MISLLVAVIFSLSVVCGTEVLYVSVQDYSPSGFTPVDGDVISFQRGLMGASYKSKSVPQLLCTPTFGYNFSNFITPCFYEFDRVDCKCINASNDRGCGWKCDPVFSDKFTESITLQAVQVDMVNMTCEGFPLEHGRSWLKGSCGLTYTLTFVTPLLSGPQKLSQSGFHVIALVLFALGTFSHRLLLSLGCFFLIR